MTAQANSPKVLHADPEHGGLRFVIILVLLLGLVLGFMLMQLLIRSVAADTLLRDFATIISCTGAIVLSLILAWAAETYLKRAWPSGTLLLLGDSELSCHLGDRSQDLGRDGQEKLVIEWSKKINLTRWSFALSGYPRSGRERRVPSNWHCLACQLQQDDTRLIVFGYFPPDEAAVWTENPALIEPFHTISLAKLYAEAGKRLGKATTRPIVPSSMVAGSDGRYWLAEQKRWQEGLELTQEDMTLILAYMEQKL